MWVGDEGEEVREGAVLWNRSNLDRLRPMRPAPAKKLNLKKKNLKKVNKLLF